MKNLPANAGDRRGAGAIPGSGRFPGEGKSNSVQYSCLENPMYKGAWWATVHGVAKSQTWLSGYHFTSNSTKRSIPEGQRRQGSMMWSLRTSVD